MFTIWLLTYDILEIGSFVSLHVVDVNDFSTNVLSADPQCDDCCSLKLKFLLVNK